MSADPATFKISTADASDVENIYLLWKKIVELHTPFHPVFSVKENSEAIIKEDICGLINGKHTSVIKAEDAKGKLAGICFIKINSKPAAFTFDKCGYIGETIVAEEFRMSGCGSLMLKFAEDWFKDRGINCVELQVALKNNPAIKFWTDAGFEPTTYHMTKFI